MRVGVVTGRVNKEMESVNYVVVSCRLNLTTEHSEHAEKERAHPGKEVARLEAISNPLKKRFAESFNLCVLRVLCGYDS